MTYEPWKILFKDTFGVKGAQYFNEVWPLLVAVDDGIKPSFLWDVCTPDTTVLISLIDSALAKGLLISKLRVVEIDLDVFIVNMTSLIRVLTNILTKEESWLIDISESEPKIPNKEMHISFCSHIISLLSQLGVSDKNVNNAECKTINGEEVNVSDSSSTATEPVVSQPSCIDNKVLSIHFPDHVNISTVFGCMLGYPHIYWWQGEKGENSLTGVPLKVYKFGAVFIPNATSVELFSFSVPEVLESHLRSSIERWGNILNAWVEKSATFSDSKFTCDPVLCLSVAL